MGQAKDEARQDICLRETKPATCVKHPNRPVRWLCSACGRAFCDECVNEVFVEAKWTRRCPLCQSLCHQSDKSATSETHSFQGALLSAPAYPLRGLGAYIIIAGAVFLWLLSTLRELTAWLAGAIHPYLGGIVGIAVGIITTALGCVVLMYFLEVLARSAEGKREPPVWPEVKTWQDLLHPLLLILAAAIYFLPSAMWHAAVQMEWLPGSGVTWVLLVVGCACFPMALTSVTLFDGIAGANPVLVISSIFRVGRGYLASVAAIALTVAAVILSSRLGIRRMAVAGPIAQTALALYLLILTMRICGITYRCHEDKLAWFHTE